MGFSGSGPLVLEGWKKEYIFGGDGGVDYIVDWAFIFMPGAEGLEWVVGGHLARERLFCLLGVFLCIGCYEC